MAAPYGTRAKAGGRKTLSSRLGFRHGRSSSAASAAAMGTKPFGSASNLLEPRTAAATSGESEMSASTLEPSPAPLGENQPPRGTRSFTVAVDGGAHSRCRPGAGGDEAPVAGTGGQVRVAFERHEFSSTSGKALGLTVSPAKEVDGGKGEALGARIDQLPRRAGAGTGGDALPTPLKAGDLLADINGQDVRRMPFSEVLRLLNAPTPHVITTTTAAGGMFSNSDTNSINGSVSSHPPPHHPGNAAKKLRGTLSAAAVGPRTPGSNSKTAPPSTSRSMAAPPPTPPSPAALAPLSPRRVGSMRTPRAFAPLLTDVRRVSWRRKVSGKWGGGKEANDNGNGRGNGKATDDGPVSAGFFSSPTVTPTKPASSSSFTRAARLNPWGGGTPGGKPSRVRRARTMFSSTFARLSPRAAVSPRPAVPAFISAGNGGGNASTAALPTTPSPASPAAAPPSPTGSSPFDKAKGSDASPADVSPVPSASTITTARCPPSSSPTTPRTGRQELLDLGAAAAAYRRISKLRFPLELDGESDKDRGLVGEDAGKEVGGEQNKVDDVSISKQPSRESALFSSSAFFPSDTERDDQAEDEGGQRRGDVGRAKETKKGHGRTLALDKDKVSGSSKLDNGHREQPQHEVQVEVEVEKEVPLREQEEEEIVALSSYLASARRGWPWTDQDVLWAEYVALNGHHRWVRSEGCRHALLLVRGALYLLELPADAVARHRAKGPPTRAVGSWYTQLHAADVSHLSVPLTPAQPGRTACADRFEAGSGLVLHKRGGAGACAWVECRNGASRDALIDLVRAWARPETIGKGKGEETPLRVELRSVGQLASGFAGRDRKGRKIPSLTDERQACLLW
eukprot:g8113.t1